MARWRLNEKAYLRVPGTEYDYKETNEETGAVNRVVFSVPRFLDPADPRQARSPEGLVCAHVGGQKKGDWIFEGPPIMGMEPLDEEAEAITAEMQEAWGNQFVGGDLDSSQELVRMMADTLSSFKATSAPASPAPATEIIALQKQVAELTAIVKSLTENGRRA